MIGYLYRRSPERATKQELVGGVEGRRGRVRSRTKWLETTEIYFEELGIRKLKRNLKNISLCYYIKNDRLVKRLQKNQCTAFKYV